MTCTVLLNDQSGLVGSVHLPLKDLDEGKKGTFGLPKQVCSFRDENILSLK